LFIVYFVGFLLDLVRTVSKIFIYMIPAAFGPLGTVILNLNDM